MDSHRWLSHSGLHEGRDGETLWVSLPQPSTAVHLTRWINNTIKEGEQGYVYINIYIYIYTNLNREDFFTSRCINRQWGAEAKWMLTPPLSPPPLLISDRTDRAERRQPTAKGRHWSESTVAELGMWGSLMSIKGPFERPKETVKKWIRESMHRMHRNEVTREDPCQERRYLLWYPSMRTVAVGGWFECQDPKNSGLTFFQCFWGPGGERGLLIDRKYIVLVRCMNHEVKSPSYIFLQWLLAMQLYKFLNLPEPWLHHL